MSLHNLLLVALLTLIPFLELRLSIPIGIYSKSVDLPFGYSIQGFGLPLFPVFFVALFTNILLGPVIYFLLNKTVNFFLQFDWINRIYAVLVGRVQKKSRRYVERFGEIGLALFIAVPLPGSGTYSGALAAHFFGLNYKKFVIANTIGVTIAALVVSLASIGLFSFI